MADVTEVEAKGPGVRAPGRAAIAAELERAGAPDDVYTAVEAEFAQEEIAALTFAIAAINGWNRLAVGLRSDALSPGGLDLPGNAAAAGSA